jgi:glycosyltransferase involved in cell wall biosynthesis
VRRPVVCFFVWSRDREAFRVAEWYRTDIEILTQLGYQVEVANSPAEIRWDADLFYTWWWDLALPPLIAARLRQRPFIVNGNVKPLRRRTLSTSVQELAGRVVLQLSDATIVSSRFEEEWLAPLRLSNIRVIYHAIDTIYHSPPAEGAVRQPLGLTITHLRYGNVERKCLRQIVEAVAILAPRLPDLRFVIAGGGDSEAQARLVALADSFGVGDRVHFPGRIDRDEKLRLLRESALYLQPTRYEGFGVAIAEAMSCGLPVVTSPVGAVPEVVGDLARFVDGNDPQQIAGAVEGLMRDPDARESLGRQGRERVETLFTFDRRKEKLAEVIAGARRRRSGRRARQSG